MINRHIGLLIFLLILGEFSTAQVAQINVPRIDRMPDLPSPFKIKDWAKVARQYDSLVYDFNRSGQYLPLSYSIAAGTNYPNRPFFGLHTYVGTNSPLGNEAINVLPSLVGATLAGIDKSNQFGRNFVLMSQDFFNRKNGENLYLNGNFSTSGNDWWYDLMPNVFFYQLYDLYPGIGGDAENQFLTIADRFLESVRTLGGDATPWQKANMNYRAFKFKTQEPNPGGVKEPEAAGAYAWLLYNAWTKTGNQKYLQGAEWSMEFLNGLTANPSYELMLPYGTYTAARMNAEIGTTYDIEKMLNWSFNRGALRGWATIVGNWNGYEMSGLVGEANDGGNDYAFQLNGVQQAAALIPMLRYDKRFANAIGKWMLHLVNNTRWYYPDELPANLQDSKTWSDIYDTDKVMAYEAIHEVWQGKSPLATGDAIKGGWAATNLSLYSTSSIGYLGGLLRLTDSPTVLAYDMLRTDFYHASAYPTYLLYNPENSPRSVRFEIGAETHDIYDAISEKFIARSVSGNTLITIPAQSAVIATLTPTDGVITFDRNRMLIDGVVVDYQQTQQTFTYAPRIQALTADTVEVEKNKTINIFGYAQDQDSSPLTYQWRASGGNISGTGNHVRWTAPDTEGDYKITLIVTDESGQADTAYLDLTAVAEINIAPVVQLSASSLYVTPDGTISLHTDASDANGDALTFEWSATDGTLQAGDQDATWTAPSANGNYEISVKVTDSKGLATTASIIITVYPFPDTYNADLIAWYPFSNNANDETTNHQNGTVSGARFVPDFKNNPSSALLFDGINDLVTVTATTLLNVQTGIAVSAMIQPADLPERESFIVSHGSWQNRYKLSILPDRKLRWTINTNAGIVDLDSRSAVQIGSRYMVTATFDGSLMAVYINGQLEGTKPVSGMINTSTLPLLIGQMLPDDASYNFTGIIDEVKIYNHAISPKEVNTAWETSLSSHTGREIIQATIYPNPSSDQVHISTMHHISRGFLALYDIMGNKIQPESTWNEGISMMNVSGIMPGIYIIKGNCDQGVLSIPIIITR